MEFDHYGYELAPVNGFKVKTITHNGILSKDIKMSDTDKTLTFSSLKSCCEHNYFLTIYLDNLIDETIKEIDLDENRKIDMDIVDMEDEEFGCYDKSGSDSAEMIDNRLKFYQITERYVETKVYVIKTESRKEVLLPLITVSNGYYEGHLTWSFE